MERRDFLKWSAVALIFGPFLVGGTVDGTDPYSREFFAQRVGRWFEAGRALFLELVAVEDGPASSQFDQFTLVFRVDVRDALADGTWSLRADSGEIVDVFLQRRADAMPDARYSASFAVTRPLSVASCAHA
jgi:hypothetical protein